MLINQTNQWTWWYNHVKPKNNKPTSKQKVQSTTKPRPKQKCLESIWPDIYNDVSSYDNGIQVDKKAAKSSAPVSEYLIVHGPAIT